MSLIVALTKKYCCLSLSSLPMLIALCCSGPSPTMRNLASEMRKRRKAMVEEAAQKLPIKMLFPLGFLIFPAIFIVLLVPPFIRVVDVLG